MDQSSSNSPLYTAVAVASHRLEVSEAITALYARIEREIGRIGPRCELSGRCCRFEEYGHRLYVTTVELAAFVAMARQSPPPEELVSQADGRACRFQKGKLCMAHSIRPMGCRLFYCDPKAEQPLQELFEQMHQQLKRLHDALGVPYYYLEWRSALAEIEPLLLEATRRGDSPKASPASAE